MGPLISGKSRLVKYYDLARGVGFDFLGFVFIKELHGLLVYPWMHPVFCKGYKSIPNWLGFVFFGGLFFTQIVPWGFISIFHYHFGSQDFWVHFFHSHHGQQAKFPRFCELRRDSHLANLANFDLII